jgi:hypothetical protein
MYGTRTRRPLAPVAGEGGVGVERGYYLKERVKERATSLARWSLERLAEEHKDR